MLLHFGLLASLSWKLTRYSAELAVNALLVLSCLGQIILIFGFATHRLEYLVAAALCYLWVSWTFLGYVAELDTSDRITLSVCNPLFCADKCLFRIFGCELESPKATDVSPNDRPARQP